MGGWFCANCKSRTHKERFCCFSCDDFELCGDCVKRLIVISPPSSPTYSPFVNPLLPLSPLPSLPPLPALPPLPELPPLDPMPPPAPLPPLPPLPALTPLPPLPRLRPPAPLAPLAPLPALPPPFHRNLNSALSAKNIRENLHWHLFCADTTQQSLVHFQTSNRTAPPWRLPSAMNRQKLNLDPIQTWSSWTDALSVLQRFWFHLVVQAATILEVLCSILTLTNSAKYQIFWRRKVSDLDRHASIPASGCRFHLDILLEQAFCILPGLCLLLGD